MKKSYLLITALLFTACASAPKAPAPVPVIPAAAIAPSAAIAPVAPPPPAEPVIDVMAGRLVGEDPMIEIPKKVVIRLSLRGKELQRVDTAEDGTFRFEGHFPSGYYEFAMRTGVIHGTRAVYFAGGELKDIALVATDGKGDHHGRHHRRRRHRAD